MAKSKTISKIALGAMLSFTALTQGAMAGGYWKTGERILADGSVGGLSTIQPNSSTTYLVPFSAPNPSDTVTFSKIVLAQTKAFPSGSTVRYAAFLQGSGFTLGSQIADWATANVGVTYNPSNPEIVLPVTYAGNSYSGVMSNTIWVVLQFYVPGGQSNMEFYTVQNSFGFNTGSSTGIFFGNTDWSVQNITVNTPSARTISLSYGSNPGGANPDLNTSVPASSTLLSGLVRYN